MASFTSRILKIFLLLIGLGAIGFLLVWGTSLKQFALWKFLVFVIPVFIYVVAFIVSKKPLNFVFNSLFIAMPVVGFILPPRQFGISFLDVIEILISLVIFGRMAVRAKDVPTFIPHGLPFLALLFILPTVIIAIDPVHSFIEFIRLVGLYLIFVTVVDRVQDKRILERLNIYLAISIIIISLSIYVQRLTGISLSGSSLNLNALTYVGNVFIQRPSGLFQDPQKAAQFLAALIVYLFTIFSFGGIEKGNRKKIVVIAIVSGFIALFLTASRNAIVACILTTLFAYLFLWKGPAIKKIAFIMVPTIIIALSLAIVGGNVIKRVVPNVYARFTTVEQSTSGRLAIWNKAWNIFLENPVSGVGPGNYKGYLISKNPSLKRYSEHGGFVPSQPESGYLKIIVETGFFGILAMLFLSAWIVKQFIKNRRLKINNMYIWATSLSMLVYLMTFITLFTPGDARNALLFIILLAFMSIKIKVRH